MSRLLAFAAVLVLAPALLPAAPVPPGADKPVYYFPTRVGTKWVYNVKGQKPRGEIVTKSEEKDGRFLVNVKTTNADFVDNDATSTDQYEVSKDGVFLVAMFLGSDDYFKPKHPRCELKLPHKDGNTWEGPKYDRVAKRIETVSVPAGKFEAIRVEIGEVMVEWYAPGVGVVKCETKDFHSELKSFELPK